LRGEKKEIISGTEEKRQGYKKKFFSQLSRTGRAPGEEETSEDPGEEGEMRGRRGGGKLGNLLRLSENSNRLAEKKGV